MDGEAQVNDFSQFLIDVGFYYHMNHDWRFGQTCFNVFAEHDPAGAEVVRGTWLDPFNDDNVVPEFLKYVRDSWV